MAIHFGTSVNSTNLRQFMISMANQYLNTAETHIVDFTKEKNIKSLSFSSVNGGHPYFELDQDLAVTDYQPKYTPQADQWLATNGVTQLGVFLNELQIAAIHGFMPQFDYIPPHKSMLGSWNAIMKRDIPPYLTIVKQPVGASVQETQEFTIEAICDRPEAHWVVKHIVGLVETDVANGVGTTATYHVQEATLDDGGSYKVVFTEDALTSTSNTVDVTVSPVPLVVTVPLLDKVVDEGGVLTLSATCNYTSAMHTIKKNGAVIVPEAAGQVAQLEVNGAQLDAAGVYEIVFAAAGQTASTSCNVVIRETPLLVTATSDDVSVNVGQQLNVTATVNRTNVTWKLYNGAQEIASGSGSDAVYSVTTTSALQSGSYRFVFRSSQQEVTTRNVLVTVQPSAFSAAFSLGFGA
jgi:hypothetical protein